MHKYSRLTLLSLLLFVTTVSCTLTESSITPDESSETVQVSEQSSSEKPVSLSSEEITYRRGQYNNPLSIVDAEGKQYFVPIADPDVIYGEDGYWYMYPTNAPVKDTTGGDFFDYGPIFRSDDLITWTWIASVFRDHPHATEWGTPGAGVWAPSVIKVNNRWNYYYSLSTWGDNNPGVGVATAPTPYGPWTHYGRVIDSDVSGVRNSIDPQTIYDGDDLYLVWGSFFGLAAILLTEDGVEPYYAHLYPDYLEWIVPDNTEGGGMNININYEGVYIFKHNDKFYLTGSQGTCCSGINSTYRVKVGVSDNLLGPYKASSGEEMHLEPFGDLVIGPSPEVAGVGHHTFIEDFAGQKWIIYHGFDKEGERPNERVLFMDEIYFDETTGMPYVEDYIASYRTLKDGPLVINLNN